ncbi:MAG: thrombospondin type 3 repeat-containing protein [Candidatus Eiseniibacteriota bacterium]|nr:MAG: thrombospondin type 3 repeat-containing protein [Candidatus Eisenbacteria bacterium]
MKSVRAIIVGVLFLLLHAGAFPFYSDTATGDLYGADGLVRVTSTKVVGERNWSAGLYGHYYGRMLPNIESVKEHFVAGNLGGRYGLTKSVEILAVLPGKGSLWDYKQLAYREERTQDHGGLSDFRLGMKMRLPLASEMFSVALMAEGAFPMGSGAVHQVPGEQYDRRLYSSAKTNLTARLCAAADFSEVPSLSSLRVMANVGYWLSREEGTVRFPSYYIPVSGTLENKDVVSVGFALEFPSPDVTLFTEFYTEQFVSGSSVATAQECPLLLTPGAKVKLPLGLIATAAFGIRLSVDDPDTEYNPEDAMPNWEFTLGFDFFPALYRQDMDQDGILDAGDFCPTEKEDFDGFEDEDGCPDPDNDRDGIPDVMDECPDVPESFDGYMDDDGCPELDTDGDGVGDSLDNCPLEAEDRDGFQDEDGCPDPDNDGDGILDVQDQCPNQPETFNGYMDEDGCPDEGVAPETDNDRDGIPDSRDKCPTLAEDIDGFQDEDGCPDIDNDLDGIIDAEDRCPNDPEDFDGFADEDGCPDRS